MIPVPRRRLGWRVTAGILAALLSAPAPLEDANRDGRWLRQLCTSDEPADVSVCDATSWGCSTASRDGGQRPDACQQGSRTTRPCRL